MPKTRSPLFSFLAKGRLGKSISYRGGPPGPQAIATPTHPDANTPSQQTQRTKFALGRDWWYDLTPEGKDYFTDPFRALFTPFASWMKYWLNALVVPHAPQHITTIGDDPLYTDPNITQPNLGQLVDGGETNLHTHAAAAVGGGPVPGFVSGRYYSTLYLATAFSTSALGPDAIKSFPFFVPGATTFNRISVQVISAAAGKVRLGVWADNGGTPAGGALLQDSGELDTAVTGAKEATINLTLQPSWYWLAILSNAGAAFLVKVAGDTPTNLGLAAIGYTAISTRADATYTYAALPNPCPPVTLVNGTVYLIFLRKA